MMPRTVHEELLELSHRLLETIDNRDWDAYAGLCDASLTAFEPEGMGHLIAGLPFHEFYFRLEAKQGPKRTTISSPHIRLMGDVAVVSYTRLVQRLDGAGVPVTVAGQETRVWQLQAGTWRHVHFHRSPQ